MNELLYYISVWADRLICVYQETNIVAFSHRKDEQEIRLIQIIQIQSDYLTKKQKKNQKNKRLELTPTTTKTQIKCPEKVVISLIWHYKKNNFINGKILFYFKKKNQFF